MTEDALRPSLDACLRAWAARVRADREQVERCREIEDPSDFYAPVAQRFRADPRRTDDEVLRVLLSLARPDETWLDIGAGGGRYALPLALAVREVVALDPSESMLAVLAEGSQEHGIANVRMVKGRWPLEDAPRADVALMAHIGYDIGEIGPFLDAAEATAHRLCVAVMGEAAMTTVATLFWEEVHGEPRIALPALPELVTLLLARGGLPEVSVAERIPPSFASVDEALRMARRQLWVRPGSEMDRRLERVARQALSERDGRYTFDRSPSRIGVVSWMR